MRALSHDRRLHEPSPDLVTQMRDRLREMAEMAGMVMPDGAFAACRVMEMDHTYDPNNDTSREKWTVTWHTIDGAEATLTVTTPPESRPSLSSGTASRTDRSPNTGDGRSG